jgi:transcriptional regulator with XRE-family HTH domain
MGQLKSALRNQVDAQYPSVKAFAKAAGLGRTTVYRLFEGELATVDVATKAAKALDMDVDQLLDMVETIRNAKATK